MAIEDSRQMLTEGIKTVNLNNRIINYDFIKGISIMFVILHHVLMRYAVLPTHTVFTIKNAVPLFIIVTILLRYRKLEHCDLSQYFHSIKKELFNIFLPFLIAETLLILFLRPNPISELKSFGSGWGSYYPLIHTQVIIFTPLVFNILKKNFIRGSIVILMFCIVSEIFFSWLNIPVWLYRLSFTRYCFLYVIAYLVFRKELLVKYKLQIIILTVLGAIFIYYHCYHNINAFFYPGWIGSKFPRDFISLVWFIGLYELCNYTPTKIRNLIVYIGKHSYDVFIIQMMFFCFLLPINNLPLAIISSFTIIFACSYPWGILMKKIKIFVRLK